MFPDDFSKNIFSPQPGISVCYTKIPDIINFVFTTAPDPNYKRLPDRKLKENNFKIPFLSAHELIMVNGFKAQKKQIEWACGRFSLKLFVQKMLIPDIALRDIRVSYHEKGAPFLTDYPNIPISLSHSGDYTAVAMGQNNQSPMGIDIEKIGTKPDAFFMKTAFTQKEISHLSPTAKEIYRHWTLKEAFLKYIKMGFNENLHMVEIIDNEIFHHGKKQNLNSWSRTIDNQYILSVVTHPPSKTGSELKTK
ncbi:MAG: 4'-phosphopantetheinyl transferase superfamily protein [Desulfobacteraceae bacterium]|nr:4'-phosphopantetheinyl transferase superfamily protein [Desulfobacteraceae bacterium]